MLPIIDDYFESHQYDSKTNWIDLAKDKIVSSIPTSLYTSVILSALLPNLHWTCSEIIRLVRLNGQVSLKGIASFNINCIFGVKSTKDGRKIATKKITP